MAADRGLLKEREPVFLPVRGLEMGLLGYRRLEDATGPVANALSRLRPGCV
jgi:hypothetical protein